MFSPSSVENLFVLNTRQSAIPEFYNINGNGGSLPTCMQGTKSEIPGIYMDPLNNGQPSQNLTIPAFFKAQGKFLFTVLTQKCRRKGLNIFQMGRLYFVGDRASGLAGASLASISASSMM